MARYDFWVDKATVLENWQMLTSVFLFISAIVWFRTKTVTAQDGRTPPSISEPFPGKNAYRYIFHNMDFLDYVKKTFSTENILTFSMGPKGFYLINSPANANAVVRSSGHFSSDALVYMAMSQLDAVSSSDINRYKLDMTSRTQISGSDVPEKERMWAPLHRIFTNHLASKSGVDILQGKFLERFGEVLERREKGKWEEVQLYKFLQEEMAKAAIVAFAGSEVLDMNEEIVEAMWRFDDHVYPLALSMPRFLYPKPYKARDKFHDLGEKWLRSAMKRYDWESGKDEDWEPLFGSRYFREHARYLIERGFEIRSMVGLLLGGMWASNANSVPMTGWLLIHVIQDKELFKTVRAAAATAFTIDPKTGEKKLDAHKLAEIPLLQSLYAETLRVHVSINITREVTQDMQLDGYALKKGYMVQTPSHIAHFDETVWGDEERKKTDGAWKPVTKFWAERHLKYVEEFDAENGLTTKAVFSTTGRTGGYFPYGGGSSMCPGRHFAKMEMLTAMALIVVNFDIELVEYVNKDGTKSGRGPEDDKWYCGTAAMPPDRDLKIRWKRA